MGIYKKKISCNISTTASMKLQLILLLACVGAAVHCSSIKKLISRKSDVSSNSASFGVFDGKNTTIKDHPSLGALIIQGSYGCQFTIISEQYVITIADCVNGYSTSELAVVVASEDGEKGPKYQVDTIIQHPDFDKNFDYNYALIKIKGKFKWSDKVKAVTLPKEAVKPNTEMVVAGWGKTRAAEFDDEPNSQFLQGTMKWLNKKKCKSIYKELGVPWTDRLACAYNKGKTTLCTDDWGDAFINKDVFYGMFQAGGTDGFCTSRAKPVLLSDAFTVLDWIKKNSGA